MPTIEWTGRPSELDGKELLAAAQLVADGQAIPDDAKTIASRIALAKRVSLIRDSVTGEILAVAVIKGQNAGYRAATFGNAAVQHPRMGEASELGYVARSKVQRGEKLGLQAAQLAMKGAKGTYYATTDHVGMKTMLPDLGFTQRGKQWKGQRGTLSLWIADIGEE